MVLALLVRAIGLLVGVALTTISSLEESFFARYARAAMELRLFVRFLKFGIERATTQADIEELLYPFLEKQALVPDGYFEVFIPSKDIRDFGRAQRDSGFPLIYRVVVVQLASILEAAIDRAARFLIENFSEISRENFPKAVKVSVVDFISVDASERTAAILEAVKQELKSKATFGVDRYEALLGVFGFSGSVPVSIKQSLSELTQVRNLIVHRAGVVDDKFLRLCPWRRFDRGNQVALTDADFNSYCAATDWYIFDVFERLIPVILKVEELKEADSIDLRKKLAEGKARWLKDVDLLRSSAKSVDV